MIRGLPYLIAGAICIGAVWGMVFEELAISMLRHIAITTFTVMGIVLIAGYVNES